MYSLVFLYHVLENKVNVVIFLQLNLTGRLKVFLSLIININNTGKNVAPITRVCLGILLTLGVEMRACDGSHVMLTKVSQLFEISFISPCYS